MSANKRKLNLIKLDNSTESVFVSYLLNLMAMFTYSSVCSLVNA